MEKRKPHCPLKVIKALIEAGKVQATGTAYQGARELGIFNLQGMCDVVLSLKTGDFYKSMTTHADSAVWQDVYHAQCPAGAVYLKLTVIDDVLIVSFKEL